MKNAKFFDSHTPCCELCEKGTERSDEKGNRFFECRFLNEKKGVDRCKKFVYDPLKRVPAKRKSIRKFSAEDFEL